MPGYIKLYRDLQNNPLWHEKPFDKARAWIDVIFRCNHVCKKVMGYGVEWILRGQFLSSNYKLAEAWGWSESTVRQFIKLLVKEKMLNVLSTRHYSLYEVTKYCVFQSIEDGELQGIDNAQKTHRKRTDHAQKTLNKKYKECKELKELINIYTQDEKLNETLNKFLDMRIDKKKVPTEYAMQLIFKTLKPFTIEIQMQMLEKSIVSQWTAVFPLKEEKPQNKTSKAPQAGNFEQRPISDDLDNYYKNPCKED